MGAVSRRSVLVFATLSLAGAAGLVRAADLYSLTLTRGSRLMLDAQINGRPVKALLDSAAETTLVSREFAKTLGLGNGQSVQGQGSGQASFDASLVGGVSLAALGLSLSNQTVAIVDLSDVGRRLLHRKVDVILGREIFDAARVMIDIAGARIGVLPRDSAPRGVKLDLITEHGVETLPVDVEASGPVRAAFDLGNGSHVLISKEFATRHHLLLDGRAVTTERGGGLGGETLRRVVTLRTVTVAGRRFYGVRAAVDPQPSASDVNVGVSVLRHFRITTDFADHAAWLEARD